MRAPGALFAGWELLAVTDGSVQMTDFTNGLGAEGLYSACTNAYVYMCAGRRAVGDANYIRPCNTVTSLNYVVRIIMGSVSVHARGLRASVSSHGPATVAGGGLLCWNGRARGMR